MLLGPDDFNGCGFSYVRWYWTGFGLPACIVEDYILLSAVLYVFVALKRIWDLKLKMGMMSGQLKLAMDLVYALGGGTFERSLWTIDNGVIARADFDQHVMQHFLMSAWRMTSVFLRPMIPCSCRGL